METIRIPVITGDGTGEDIWNASREIFEEALSKSTGNTKRIEWIPVIAGLRALEHKDHLLPAETVDQALSYLPGVHVERPYGMTSQSSTVSLRGMGNQQGRTLVLVDGVPQNTSDTGSVTWNRLNLEDVERIEVLKGPAAAIYGDNAMGGIINIITVKPTKYFQGSTSASYGTNADWQMRGVAAGRVGPDRPQRACPVRVAHQCRV